MLVVVLWRCESVGGDCVLVEGWECLGDVVECRASIDGEVARGGRGREVIVL